LGLDRFPVWVKELYHPGSFFWIVNNINFQYFSILITIFSTIVMAAVSYMSASPEYEKIRGLTFGTATTADREDTRSSWSWIEVVGSLVILACIVGAYVYFTG
jgi:SSS family solute:Na+ symporter